jgi:RNA polymerase subunit RPABC4/transcription elongation factor Spt4
MTEGVVDPDQGSNSLLWGVVLIIASGLVSLTVVGIIIGIPLFIIGLLMINYSLSGADEHILECPECETKLGKDTETCPECGEEDLDLDRLRENYEERREEKKQQKKQKKKEKAEERRQKRKEISNKKWKPCPECGEDAMFRDGTFDITMDGLLADLVCDNCGNEEKAENMYA